MGPKWFTSINPQWASPVKNYILCFVLCQAAIALYSFWLGSYMQGLTVTGMEIVSVWGVTTIAALIFLYARRSKGIWDSSPYKTWKFLGVLWYFYWAARSKKVGVDVGMTYGELPPE